MYLLQTNNQQPLPDMNRDRQAKTRGRNLRLSAQSALSVFYFLLPATAGSFGMTGCLAIQAILTHKPEYALRHSEDARVGRLYSLAVEWIAGCLAILHSYFLWAVRTGAAVPSCILSVLCVYPMKSDYYFIGDFSVTSVVTLRQAQGSGCTW